MIYILKILKSQKFWMNQYRWICSYLLVEMSWRITAPYPLDAAAGGSPERAADDNKSCQESCVWAGVYSPGLGDLVSFCSLLL